MAEIEFSIVNHLGKLAEGRGGWIKELNKVSWNGRPAKYDIREWSPDHQKMGKGVTLSDEEAATLYQLLAKDLGDTGEN